MDQFPSCWMTCPLLLSLLVNCLSKMPHPHHHPIFHLISSWPGDFWTPHLLVGVHSESWTWSVFSGSTPSIPTLGTCSRKPGVGFDGLIDYHLLVASVENWPTDASFVWLLDSTLQDDVPVSHLARCFYDSYPHGQCCYFRNLKHLRLVSHLHLLWRH